MTGLWECGSLTFILPIGVQRTAISNGASTLDQADQQGSEIGNILVGFKHRLIGENKDNFRLSTTGMFRAPTGQTDDPLNTHDIATGDGQWDIGVFFFMDYRFNDNFEINFKTQHEYQLSGSRRATDLLNTTQSIPMDFQPGFYNRFSVRPRFKAFFETFELELSIKAMYEHEYEEKQQRFNATTGNYSGLMKAVSGTDSMRLTLLPRIGINLIKSKIPLIMYVGYGKVVRGKNTTANEYGFIRFDFFFGGEQAEKLF